MAAFTDIEMGDRRCVSEWHIRQMCHFVYEVPAQVVAPLLPAGLSAVEPRPGVALLSVGYVDWLPGNNEGRWPAFLELTIMVLVHPDLSLEMPTPRYSYY